MGRRLFLAIAAALCLAALLPAPRAHATACTGGCVQYQNNGAFSGTAQTFNYTGATAGNNLHIWACASPNASNSVSSITVGGNAATLGGTQIATSKACAMAVYPNVAGGTSSIVVTWAQACSNCNVTVTEWSGEATSSVIDAQTAGAPTGGSSAPLPCGSLTTANANDHVEYMILQESGVAPTAAPSQPSAYSATLASVNDWWGYYVTTAAAGTFNPTATSGASSFGNDILCAAFKLAGGGGPTLPAGSLMLMGTGK